MQYTMRLEKWRLLLLLFVGKFAVEQEIPLESKLALAVKLQSSWPLLKHVFSLNISAPKHTFDKAFVVLGISRGSSMTLVTV